MQQRFAAGAVVATPGALGLGLDLLPYVQRHLAGDWGTCGRYEDIDLTADEAVHGALATSDDGKLNIYAIRNGGRVLSAYDTPAGRCGSSRTASRRAATAERTRTPPACCQMSTN